MIGLLRELWFFMRERRSFVPSLDHAMGSPSARLSRIRRSGRAGSTTQIPSPLL